MFNEARAYMIDGDWASTDAIYCALITNATVPTAADLTPALGDYTELTAGGNYATGGVSLGTLANFVSQAGGTVTFDSATNPSWLQDAANPTNCYYAIVYNNTQAGDPAWFYVDMGGPVDMTGGDTSITWNASGLGTIS